MTAMTGAGVGLAGVALVPPIGWGLLFVGAFIVGFGIGYGLAESEACRERCKQRNFGLQPI